jgi:two-component system, response regulator
MTNCSDVEILLVDDNPNDAENTIQVLKQNNIANRILVIGNGEEALDYLFARGIYRELKSENRPRIILLSLKLAKINGLEILRALRSDRRTKILPVVLLVSSMEEKQMIEDKHSGVNSYIVKPVDFEKFIRATRDLGLHILFLNQPPKE